MTAAASDPKPSGSTRAGIVLLPLALAATYFNDQVARFLVYDLVSLSPSEKWVQILLHFVSTSLKIFLLLYTFVYVMALVRTWFPMDKVKKRLGSLPVFPATFGAGIFGVFTPFCSCSAVPLFISFLESGFPLGLTFTFLIASPLVNEIVIIMLAGLFGIRIALLYAAAGLTIAISAGLVIDRLNLKRFLPAWILDFQSRTHVKTNALDFNSRVLIAENTVRGVMQRVWPYVLAGIAASSLISGYVPENWLTRFTDDNQWFALPLAILAGLPLYACSASVAPVAFSLVDKGLPPGVALVFVMAVAGLSLPELIMLRKVLSLRLLAIFAAIVFIGILTVGTMFYWLL